MEAEQACYSLICCEDMEPLNEQQLKLNLEKGDTRTKIETLKKIICYISNGERLPGVLMCIIRFVMPLQDHTLKKLMLIFWEIVPKTKADGTLLQEIILVCDAYRKDLEHSNEFIRGATLRFLCKLKEPELLEPLMTPIRNCLDHKSSYVRRNAVLAIFTIYKNFPFLIPDAAELILKFLEAEKDMSCKRNAFLMLLHTDLERALSYLVSCLDEVTSFGDILQLMVVQLMHKVCLENPQERPRFIRVMYSLLNSRSAAVRYEASGTLLTLTSAPTAVKAAASCYISIITHESDNNVKLIVLERLISLKDNSKYEKVLQELVMDILRVLACSDLEVKEKTLILVLDLITQGTVGEVVSVIKKEIAKVRKNPDQDDAAKYFQILVRTIHLSSIKYRNVASSVVPFIMDLLPSNSAVISQDVITYIKESVERFHFLRTIIINKFLDMFTDIQFSEAHQSVLWILGEYVNSIFLIEKTLAKIKNSLGNLPIVDDELKLILEETRDSRSSSTSSEGMYLRQSSGDLIFPNRQNLRKRLIEGNFIVGAIVSTTLVKLAIKYETLSKEIKYSNNFLAECVLIISSILRYGNSNLPVKRINLDDVNRMLFCIKVLTDKGNSIKSIFINNCHRAFLKLLSIQSSERSSAFNRAPKTKRFIQVDDTVTFSQLSKLAKFDIDTENMFELHMNNAVTGNGKKSKLNKSTIGNGKITQLTGFSDPVYVEAFIQPSQYDITLEILIVNRTDDLLENCCLELATLGQLRLLEKPQTCVLPPRSSGTVRTVVRVSSTENGIIFGKIFYDLGRETDRGMVVLDDIHIDIADHLQSLSCSEEHFRMTWAELEWENKVRVSTYFTDLGNFSKHILKLTNMYCLTPEKVFLGSCRFLAANFYARSLFGEDVLVNVCLEKLSDAPEASITGCIRIRAKSQGMVLYLGEMIKKGQNRPIRR